MRSKSFKIGLAVATSLTAALAAGGASAATLLFNLGLPSGDIGKTHTYTVSGLSIIATGYNNDGHKTDLFGKNAGGDEVGLGLTTDTTGDHEIQYHEGFVQLDLSDLFGKVKTKSTFFATNSTTNGEEWGVYGSNKAGSYNAANLLTTGTTETSRLFAQLGKYKYYDFVELNTTKGQGNNFLIHDVTIDTSATPEPATWAMMLIGFGGLGAAMRSARRRAAAAA